MNIFGTILAWVCVLLAAGAVYMTSKTIAVRNSWTAKNDKLRQQYEGLAGDVEKREQQLRSAEEALTRETLPWGRHWVKVNTQAGREPGAVAIELGTNNGLKPGNVLYGFEPLPEGGFVYRGDFQVTQEIRENQALLQPRFRIRQEDVARWKPGTWQWRELIPSGYVAKFEERERQLLAADALLDDRRNTQEVQTNLVAAARDQLDQKENELFGGPKLPRDDALAPEYTKGIVPTIAATEDDRNGTLLEVDQLRHELRSTRQQFDATHQQNLNLIPQLPYDQPPPATANRTR